MKRRATEEQECRSESERSKRAKSSNSDDRKQHHSPPPALLRRREPDEIGFDSLDVLSLDVIFSFLDVKALFRLVFLNKVLRSVLSHEHVVRSAVASGGRASRATERIVLLLGDRTIFTPSPLRLLRLANGRTCERGGPRCCCRRRRPPAGVRSVRPRSGLFLCRDCLADATVEVRKSDIVLQNSRLSWRRHRKGRGVRVMRRPYTDSAGERAGAIVTVAQFSSVQKQSERMDDDDVYRGTRDAIIECFERATEARKRRAIELLRAKQNKKEQREEKVKAIVQTVQTYLDAEEQPWTGYVLSCTYDKDAKTNYPCARFRCCLVDDIMMPYIMSPSKATEQKLRQMVNEIRHDVGLIYSKGLLDFSFFLDVSNAHPFEKAMRSSLRDVFGPREVLLHENVDRVFLALLREDKLLEALAYRFRADEWWSCNRLCNLFHPLESAFVGVVVPPRSLTLPDMISRSDAQQLAGTIWRNHSFNSSGMSSEEVRDAFSRQHEDAFSQFSRILPFCRRYLALVENDSFWADENHSEEHKRELRLLFNDIWRCERAPDFLEKEDYDGLRKYVWDSRSVDRNGPTKCTHFIFD